MDCTFQPFSEAYDRDPHPAHAHLRRHHRVYRWEEMDAWVLSHHADVDWLLKRAPVGTSDVHWERAVQPSDASRSPWDELRRQTITFLEGAEHARVRRCVSRTFTPSAVARLAPAIARAVGEALERIGEGAGEFDLVAEMTSRVPMQVLGRLLGVPSEMEPEFCRHAARLQNVINPLGDASARAEADASALRFRALIEELLARAERRSRDADLLSALVHLDAGEDRLDRDALMGLTTSIIMAGAETTGGMVNHGVHALLGHPGQLALLRQEPERIAAAVEELARFEFPTKFVTRYPLEPIEVAGTRIGKGQLVFGALGAANRDPSVFRDPDCLDIARPPGPTLTFGAGAHFCLGAALARAEAREMIGALVARFPALAVAAAPTFTPHFNIRMMTSFRLTRGPVGAMEPGRGSSHARA